MEKQRRHQMYLDIRYYICWKTYYEKADNIRDKRNCIHLMKALKAQNKFDEKECRKVINDLQKIIDSRYIYQKKGT